MSGDVQFNGTPEEWDALVKKSRQNKLLTEIMAEDAKDGLYKKQTAVEWLFHKLWDEPKDKFTWYAILQQAKEMEKEQIMTAWESGFTAHKIDEKYGIDKTEFSSDKYYDNNYKQ